MSFLFISVTTLALGRTIKNRFQVLIFRTGIILYLIYVLIIALLKDNIIYHYIWLGMFYGIVQGVLWSAGHFLVNIYANDVSNKFVSYKSIFSKTLKIIFPFIFGTSIELTSFSTVAIMVLFLSIIQFSLLIKEKDIGNVKLYSLKDFSNYLKRTKNKSIKYFYKIMFYDGIVHYLLDTLITIMIVMTFKTNISLSVLTTVFSICSILSVYVFQRKLKNNNAVIFLSTVMTSIGVIILLFNINLLYIT